MFDILNRGLSDFRHSYKRHLSFALIYMLITSVLFLPLISFIFNRILKALGTGSLLNAEVYRLGLTTAGMTGVMLISFLTVIILFVEFGVMIIIAQQTYFKKHITVSDAFVTAVKKLPALFGFGIIQMIFVFLLIIPFLDSPVFPALLDINWPILVTGLFYSTSNFVMFLYFLAFLTVVFFFIRLIFTIYFIFIEKKTVWKAMKNSWKMTKSNKLKILFNLLLLNLLAFLAGFLVMTFLAYLPGIIDLGLISRIIENYLVAFSSFMAVLFSLLIIPVNIIILTRLFFHFKQNQGYPVQDDLSIQPAKKLNLFENRVAGFFTKKKYTLAGVIMVYVTSVFFINYTVADNIVYLKWNVEVAAHRGDLHAAPENSISSMQAALDQGVDAVEIDVMLTADDKLVLNHDETFERVAGVPDRVEEMTFEEATQVDIGTLYSDEFAGETVPSLREALELMKDSNANIIIDIKINDLDRSREMAEGIVKLVEEFEMEDTAYVQAFENRPLREIRQLNPDITIGQILYLAAGDLDTLDVDFYAIRQTMLTERFVEAAHSQDREVWVWTVNTPRNIREVLKYDIDGIITDYPTRVQRMIGIDFEQEPDNDLQ
ncbi:glycerophosphoryl diester phosphodiesterase membrane domain-containing protein [Salipaludibacillus sp. CUR1]|uniref:glycerophosphodiester phosphodiesterase family protein n=1 Tax=Salipaludibacillus sp. CUR1 TaxID=2820003 RepID=UPI001E4F0B5C|nr:glycerophosphodiester phosphodiesterase family protein [Salipaludibacillus sp. CUR1]MCE7793818.1 glycerophosphoryl diester phosphodiesterase membrane domain-containing protein [Salipaludibacillus sp. CUR1]